MNFVDKPPVQVLGGKSAFSGDTRSLFTTVLGSCVSACIFDPRRGIGGINHFILPTGGSEEAGERRLRYGDTAMDAVVHGVLKRGAKRPDLRVKLYGGRCRTDLADEVGIQNARFAMDYCAEQALPVVDADLGGNLARWITFHPASGRIWLKVTTDTPHILEQKARSAYGRA